MKNDKQFYIEKLKETSVEINNPEDFITTIKYPNDRDLSTFFLRENCSVQSIAGDGDLSIKGLNLTKWVNSSFRHDGNVDQPVNQMDSKSIWEHYQGNLEHGIGCGVLANFLSQAFDAIGIKTRLILCLSCQPDDNDTHTLVMAYDEKYPNGLAFDPTVGTDFRDVFGMPLNLEQVREKLIAGEDVEVKSDIGFDYMTYMAKNLFRFQVYDHSYYHSVSEETVKFYSWWCPQYSVQPYDDRIPSWRKNYAGITYSYSSFWKSLE